MNRAKLMAYIGVAARARKCQSGDCTCEKLVKTKKAKLIILDAGASGNTREKYKAMCENAGIECICIDELGRQIGKPSHKIAAVTDRHFAEIIRQAYEAPEQA